MKRFFSILPVIMAMTIFISLTLNCRPVRSQDDEVLRLRQKISELEKRVNDMEKLLTICTEEQKTHDEMPGWQNKKNWRKLTTGMTKEQVESILGEPTKMISGVRTLWYYPNIYCGYVSFDEKGNLIGWNEP